ncbi:MAG: hypothetical protein ACLFSQ_04680 [Candidatus Zixiibacteriota bacterium]
MSEIEDDGYVDATPEERFEMTWQMTLALWEFMIGEELQEEPSLRKDIVRIYQRGENQIP